MFNPVFFFFFISDGHSSELNKFVDHQKKEEEKLSRQWSQETDQLLRMNALSPKLINHSLGRHNLLCLPLLQHSGSLKLKAK